MIPVSGHTKLAAVIGDPVKHSLSPKIHNAAFVKANLDWLYVAFPVETGQADEAVEAMRTLGIGGLSVTMPHKATVARSVDGLTPAAEALDVVNCVFWDDDRLIGDATDGDGLVAAINATPAAGELPSKKSGSQLVQQSQQSRYQRLDGKQVAVVGTGGAARSIVEAVGRLTSAEVVVCGRSAKKAQSAALLADGARVVDLNQLRQADVIIQATVVGMVGGPEGTPVPFEFLRPEQLVVDIIYQPRMTPLLQAAADIGAETMNGLPMLVHQAARAFYRWTGTEAPLEVMTAAVC